VLPKTPSSQIGIKFLNQQEEAGEQQEEEQAIQKTIQFTFGVCSLLLDFFPLTWLLLNSCIRLSFLTQSLHIRVSWREEKKNVNAAVPAALERNQIASLMNIQSVALVRASPSRFSFA
jgi:hypothetical protein